MCNEVDADLWWCMPHQADDNYMVEVSRLIRDNLKPSLKWYCEYSNELWNWGPGFCQFGWVNGNNGVGACPGAADSIQDAILAVWQSGGHPETIGYMANRTFRHAMTMFTGANRERLVRVVAGQAGWFDVTRRAVEWTIDNGDGCDAVAIAPYFGMTSSAVTWFCGGGPDRFTTAAIVDSIGHGQQAEARQWAITHGQYAAQQGLDLIYYEGGVDYGYSDCTFTGVRNDSMMASAYTDGMYQLTLDDIAIAADPQVNCKVYVPLILYGEPHHYGHIDSASQVYLPSAQWPAKYRALRAGNATKVTHTAPPVSDAPRTAPRSQPRAVVGVGARRGLPQMALYALDGRLVFDPAKDGGVRRAALPHEVLIAAPKRATVQAGKYQTRHRQGMKALPGWDPTKPGEPGSFRNMRTRQIQEGPTIEWHVA
jgi:hypothetical protein